jgi:hydroxyacylglutathione hydrolase
MPQVKTIAVGPLQANCYIVSRPGREDCVLIDPGAEPERILQAAGKRVAAVLLTHGHFDHIGAVAGVLKEDTPLYIHPLDEGMLRDPAKNLGQLMGMPLALSAPAAPVGEGDILHAGGMAFSVLHTPGHTPGGVCYRLGDVLFSGDTLFHRGYGRTDFPGGDWGALYLSLKRLLALGPEVRVCPGHSEETTIGIERGLVQ